MSALKFFKLNTCFIKDHEHCMIHHAPDKVRHVDFMLSWGERIGALYPSDLNDCRVYMEDGYGSGLAGLISNTNQFLIVSAPIKETIVRYFPWPEDLETLRVVICDHKRRVAGDDYWFINPIGTLDCLDQKRSVIKRTAKGDVVSVKSMVLRQDGLHLTKPLFRPSEAPQHYIIRHDLLMAIKDLNLPVPNIYVEEIEVTGATG